MRLILFLLSFFSYLSSGIAQPVEIVMWHSLAGYLGQELKQITDEFNQSQPNYLIKPVYKGDYIDSLTSFAASFRAKQPPALIQVFEVGTANILYPPGIIKPLAELLQENAKYLPEINFFPVIRDFYSEFGQLQAMPFNLSIPVIFYNADLLAEVGYNQDNFPTTWQEMEILAQKLQQQSKHCAYSSAYPSWIQIEAFASLHGLPLIDSHTHQAIYNNSALIHHLERLKRWQTKHYFIYGGRSNDATILFTSGHCAMFSQSSGGFNSLQEMVSFKLGVAALPLDIEASEQRHANIVGGAALWAVNGQSPEVYRGIIDFYIFFAQPRVQQQWYQHTGYIPLGLQGTYHPLARENNPILNLALKDLTHQNLKRADKIYRGPQNQIRSINDEAMEAIFSDKQTSKQALDEAVKRANYALKRFRRNTQIN